jgi:hypothetical protein
MGNPRCPYPRTTAPQGWARAPLEESPQRPQLIALEIMHLDGDVLKSLRSVNSERQDEALIPMEGLTKMIPASNTMALPSLGHKFPGYPYFAGPEANRPGLAKTNPSVRYLRRIQGSPLFPICGQRA